MRAFCKKPQINSFLFILQWKATSHLTKDEKDSYHHFRCSFMEINVKARVAQQKGWTLSDSHFCTFQLIRFIWEHLLLTAKAMIRICGRCRQGKLSETEVHFPNQSCDLNFIYQIQTGYQSKRDAKSTQRHTVACLDLHLCCFFLFQNHFTPINLTQIYS